MSDLTVFGQPIPSTQATDAEVAAAVAAALATLVKPGQVLSEKHYRTVADTTVCAITSTSYVDVDATNLVFPSFTAPASGAVWVDLMATGRNNGGTVFQWAVASPSRTVTDGVTTNGSAVVTSATGAFTDADIGMAISGTGIPARAYVLSRQSATQVTMSVNATADGTGISVTFGGTIPNSGGYSMKGGSATQGPGVHRVKISNLSPGATYTGWKWQGKVDANTGNIYVGDTSGYGSASMLLRAV